MQNKSFSHGRPARSGGYTGDRTGRPAKFHRPRFKGPSATGASSASSGTRSSYGANAANANTGAGVSTGAPTSSGAARSYSRPAYSGSRSYSSGSSYSSGGRSSYSSNRSGHSPRSNNSRGGSRGGFRGQRIDVSKFISKAVITEEVEKFIPEHKFSDFPIDEKLKISIDKRGYNMPTPIQDRAIPHILRGEDIVGIANTGTGKTGAFLIPLIHKVLTNPKENVLIVVPTRELALQIDQELKLLTGMNGIYSVCCVGGAPIGKQVSALRYRNQFIIGTPGRIKDLMERGNINLSLFNTIVLDEADRMLDMGFIADMKFMVSQMPPVRHTLFFSATLSPEIEKLIHAFLRSPARISVKTSDTSKNVDQDIVRVRPGSTKLDMLVEMLSDKDFNKVLIFGRTKHGVEKLSKYLAGKGIAVDCIHGDKTHSNRQRALRAFKENQIKALVATDVAARGLDIPNVSHVINFDIPSTYEDYTHRIGRTGRAGKVGKALTFIES